MPLKPLLIGEKLRLTTFKSSDAPIIATWQQDNTFLRLMDAIPAYPKTEDQLKAWIESIPAQTRDYTFAIRLIENDALLGWVELDGIMWNNRVSGISIAIGDTKQRGKGYGAEAMQLVLGFAFNELNLHRIQLTVFAYNAQAIKLYEQLGFQKEGVYREFLERDGKRHDMILYGLLRHEWQAQQP